MSSERKAIVIGAGIAGLAHAWSAAKRGYRVTLIERSAEAQGGSIRNFGMVWPIGQTAGRWHRVALASRRAWLELRQDAGIWVAECGSLHLAHREDEWAVITEFAERAAAAGYECERLPPDEVRRRSPGANPTGLLGGLFSPTELAVNPRVALPALATWLSERLGVELQCRTAAREVVDQEVRCADGSRFSADRIVVCGGADFETLYPERLQRSGLKRCKLQMMRTEVQRTVSGDNWRLGPHLASGLTLRHYANFADCPSLAPLKRRIAEETPELDQFGIHVMASQNDAGEVILGDSHEYDRDIEPWDKTQIDALIERELRKILQLPTWRIAQRWHGVYAKHPTAPVYIDAPSGNVRIMTGLGGSGMTMSFGLAEELWETWESSGP